jgi:hypothetical protein
MSFTATRASRRSRKTCQACRARQARFCHRGVIRADRDHTLCFECFRAERERQRARRLVGADPAPGGERPVFGDPPRLDDRQRAHRRAMLAHLERLRASPAASTDQVRVVPVRGVPSESPPPVRRPAPDRRPAEPCQ